VTGFWISAVCDTRPEPKPKPNRFNHSVSQSGIRSFIRAFEQRRRLWSANCWHC